MNELNHKIQSFFTVDDKYAINILNIYPSIIYFAIKLILQSLLLDVGYLKKRA